MFLKVYKSRVWIMLFMLLPFIGNAQLPGLPPGWGFTLNPTSATYAIPTTVAYNNGLGALQAGDWVGAFFEDAGVLKCAGAVQWIGTGNVALVAFGNDALNPVKNGFADGELVKWKFYRTGTSVELCVKAYNSLGAEFNWGNGLLEVVASFGTCAPPLAEQSFDLSTGWNWLSFNVIPLSGDDLNSVLGDSGYTDGDLILTPGGVAEFFEGFGWFGDLEVINPDAMYQMFLAAPKYLLVEGMPVDVSDPIVLLPGWNWIGYKPQVPLDINVALVSPSFVDGDLILTPGGVSEYFEGFGWFGDLEIMYPGFGYQINVANGTTITYPVSVALNLKTSNTNYNVDEPNAYVSLNVKEAPVWPNPPVFPFYQVGRFRVFINGSPITTAGSMLSIWKDGQIRGKANLQFPPGGNPPQFQLQMGSNLSTEPGMNFLAYDVATDMVYEIVEIHNFVSGQTVGTVGSPLPLTAISAPATTDICGTVTDAVSGLPVQASITAITGNAVYGNPNWPAPVVFPFYQVGRYRVYVEGTAIITSGSVLSAWKDGAIRGRANIQFPPGGNPPQFQLQMGSNLSTEQGYTFKVYNSLTDQVYEIEETHNFVSGLTIGTVGSPIPLTAIIDQVIYETTTGVDGTYCIVDVQDGTYTISAEAVGYIGQTFEDVLVEASVIQDFALVPIITCEDATIANFPTLIEDFCGGGYNINFVNVLTTPVDATVIWSVDPVTAGYFDQYVFWGDLDYTGPVTISLLVEAVDPCEDAFASVSFNVFAFPVIDCPEYGPFCEGDEAIMFTEEGEFHYDGETITGWNPDMAGMFMIHYVYTDPVTGCSSDCMFEIVVNPLPEAPVCPQDFEICVNAEPFVFGDWTFDPSMYLPGEYEFTFTNENECGVAECTFYVTVLPLPEAPVCPADFEICVNAEPFEFGDWTFDPSMYLPGEYEFTFFNENECGIAECTFYVTVLPLPEPPVCPENEYVCITDAAFEIGGILFDPAVYGVGVFEFTLTEENECGVAECTFYVTVFDLPIVTCPDPITVFLSALPITLEGATPMGGAYSGEGVMGNDFFVLVTGEYLITYTYTDLNTGCTNFCEFVISVEEEVPPVPELVFANLQWPPTGEICLDNFQPLTVYGQVVIENGVLNPETGYEGLVVEFGISSENSDPATWTTWTPSTGFHISEFGVGPEYSAQLGFGLEAGVYYYATKYTFMDEVFYGGWGEDYVGGFWNGVENFSGVLTVIEVCVQQPCSIEWANVQWPLSGEITLGDDFTVYAQVYSANYPGQEIPGIEAWIGYCMSDVHPSEFMFWVPATFNGFAGNNSEFMANIGAAITEPGTYYYASKFLCPEEGSVYVYGGIGGFWNNNSGVLVVLDDEPPVCEVTCPEDFEVCANAMPFMLTGAEPMGGVYSGAGVMDGMFYPEFAGDFVITYTYDCGNGLEASCEFTITVIGLPEVECPADFEICVNAEPFEFGDWTFDPSMYAPGVYEFTFTAENECGVAECTFYVTVLGLPEVECPADFEICVNADPFVFGDWTFDPSMYEAGVYEFTFTEENECGVAACTFFVTVIGLPEVECPADFEICVNADPFVFGDWTFDPSMYAPGVYEFTFTAENECGVAECTFYVTVIGVPVIIEQPVDLTVEWGEDAVFTVVAENVDEYQWYGPNGLIAGATNATLTLLDVTFDDAGGYYVELSNDCDPARLISMTAFLTVDPWTQVLELNGQVNGISTYLDLIEDQIGTIVAPIVANLQYVEFYQPNQVYVPGGAPIAWNEAKGAKVGLSGGFPTTLTVTGIPTLGTVVPLPAGWSLMPVWSFGPVAAADVFGPLGAQVTAAFSIDYAGVYWPQYNINTLGYLMPGSAYLVALTTAGSVNFDVTPVKAATPGYVSLPANTTTWKSIQMTGVQHNIAITANALAQLRVGDVIGAFNQKGDIAGMVEVTDLTNNTVIRIYGNEFTSKSINGFVVGDVLSFRVYRNGEVIDLEATFNPDMPNTNVFAENGLSAIVDLKAGATAINDFTSALNVNLYPNPAKDFVNIETNFEIRNLKVVNYVGQVVLDQNVDQISYQINTSNFGPGMYFVQIQTVDGVVITKRLTVN